MKSCPCCSGKLYAECCQPLHEGALAPNALSLMRSRYSAYALHLPDYILKTTHPDCPQYQKDAASWKKSISTFSSTCRFEKLEILDVQEGKEVGFVTFRAHLWHGAENRSFTEKSRFEKVEGKWLYRSGEMSS